MRTLFTLVFILAFLTACTTSTGKKISQDQLSFVREGETTYTQVVKKFGPPDEETKESDGTKHIVYRYDSASSNGLYLVPLIGPLLSTTETEGHYVSFIFDTKNLVKEYNVRKIQSGTTDRR